MLSSITIKDVGFAKNISLHLANRLNLITGDNGLGKSLLLESCWWALSKVWAATPIYPYLELENQNPEIHYSLRENGHLGVSQKAQFSKEHFTWNFSDKKQVANPEIVIYSRTDNLFAVYDPIRQLIGKKGKEAKTVVFTKNNLWNGLSYKAAGKTRFVCNGLIQDWVNWQNLKTDTFQIFSEVLETISPPSFQKGDLGILKPGQAVRIPEESRLIPTLKHSYGEVPVLFASAAVQRILSLAYLIVWTWEEHKTQAQVKNKPTAKQLTIIIDEIEAHLHPKWQRLILPALMKVVHQLSPELEAQLIISTHSPLILASVEPFFQIDSDKIFHLDVRPSNNGYFDIELEDFDYQKRGTVDSWLTSEIFELETPRSIQAEESLHQAKALMMNEQPALKELEKVNQLLTKYLNAHDKFWVRWNYFIESKGLQPL